MEERFPSGRDVVDLETVDGIPGGVNVMRKVGGSGAVGRGFALFGFFLALFFVLGALLGLDFAFFVFAFETFLFSLLIGNKFFLGFGDF